MSTRLFLRIVLCLATLPALVHAAVPEQESGKEIYGPCAACHGDLGQGGKRGEYPRLAGQRAAYIEYTLKKFRSRERINIPMFPYTQERELPDADIKVVAAYLASIQLPTKIPEFKPTDDALTRLLAMEKVMIIPKLEGDLENGKRLYQEECAYCHGVDGRGKTRFPMLVGQYTNYLQKQIAAYIKGERPHDKVADDEEEDDKSKPKAVKLGVLNRLTEKDIQDILAYITHLQDE
ncbi:c-type cytochrome [Sulfuricystis thermophila]|uniref:c-type cytochrome n=1 Tax=Sulfuricystis thermophila TaxID=2496847 RepID=UPI001035922D|nr:c-type cytochrome [Sulfuricystis thermophila]